jgi:hypothetical protein
MDQEQILGILSGLLFIILPVFLHLCKETFRGRMPHKEFKSGGLVQSIGYEEAKKKGLVK